MWVAVEALAQPQTPSLALEDYSRSAGASPARSTSPIPNDTDQFRHLVDVEIEIRPSHQCKLLRLVDGTGARPLMASKSDPAVISSTIDLSDMRQNGLLILALVELPPVFSITSSPPLSSSSSLLADLEVHLGSHMVQYMSVQLKTRLAAPPFAPGIGSSFDIPRRVGAKGLVRRHDSASIWASANTRSSPGLFPIIAAHWGLHKAHEAIHNHMLIMAHTSPESCRNDQTTNVRPQVRKSTNEIEAARVPQRRTSLQRTPSPQPVLDRAQQIWMTIKRAHSGDHPDMAAATIRRDLSRNYGSVAPARASFLSIDETASARGDLSNKVGGHGKENCRPKDMIASVWRRHPQS
ncbi:hypothetical protein Micbo1qcDRAFT_162424 [Microdochium bolleyi]|uniref:Uncharacterized protein n=1 Tax=Microdochium bolleyi TaxID=196109 RepID=A0A136J504_9PEZI|nr:hypothetical protein Micbo1qcDRAFT_162424 [Microdochium bolleyi]